MSFGLEYILDQIAPCALTKLISHLGRKDYGKPDETYNVTIHDARTNRTISRGLPGPESKTCCLFNVRLETGGLSVA